MQQRSGRMPFGVPNVVSSTIQRSDVERIVRDVLNQHSGSQVTAGGSGVGLPILRGGAAAEPGAAEEEEANEGPGENPGLADILTEQEDETATPRKD